MNNLDKLAQHLGGLRNLIKNELPHDFDRVLVDSLYKTHTLTKPDGSIRQIQAPVGQIMPNLQLINRNLQEAVPTHPCSMAVKGQGIIKNAQLHKDGQAVLRIDIRQFYQNCFFGRVVKGIEYTKNTELAELVKEFKPYLFYQPLGQMNGELGNRRGKTNQERYGHLDWWLPTGSPTSPFLSNFAVAELDDEFQKLVGESGGRYTRYLDDMVFSWKEKPSIDYLPLVKESIESKGWQVNWKKSGWLDRHNNTWSVTGVAITTNGELKAPRAYMIRMRAVLDKSAKFHGSLFGNFWFTPLKTLLGDEVLGELAFVRQVNKEQFKKCIDYYFKRLEHHWLETSKRSKLPDEMKAFNRLHKEAQDLIDQ